MRRDFCIHIFFFSQKIFRFIFGYLDLFGYRFFCQKPKMNGAFSAGVRLIGVFGRARRNEHQDLCRP